MKTLARETPPDPALAEWARNCDRCPAQHVVRAVFSHRDDSPLRFCEHHFKEFRDYLADAGASIEVDDR